MRRYKSMLFFTLTLLAAACKPVQFDTDSSRFDIALTDGSKIINTIIPKDDGKAVMQIWVYTTHDFRVLDITTSKNANTSEGFEFDHEKYFTQVLTPNLGEGDDKHYLITSNERKIDTSAPETLTIKLHDEATNETITKSINYTVNKYFGLALTEIKTRNYTFSSAVGNLDNTYVTDGSTMTIRLSSTLERLKLKSYELTGGSGTYDYHESSVFKVGETYQFTQETGQDQYYRTFTLDNISIKQYSNLRNVKLSLVFANPEDESQEQTVEQYWTHNTKFKVQIKCINSLREQEGDGKGLPLIYGSMAGDEDHTKLCLDVTSNRQQIYIKSAQLKFRDKPTGTPLDYFVIITADSMSVLIPNSRRSLDKKTQDIEDDYDFGNQETYTLNQKIYEKSVLRYAWTIYDCQDPNISTATSTSGEIFCESVNPQVEFVIRSYEEYLPSNIVLTYIGSGKNSEPYGQRDLEAGYFKTADEVGTASFPNGLPVCLDIIDDVYNYDKLTEHEFSFEYPEGGYNILAKNAIGNEIGEDAIIELCQYKASGYGEYTKEQIVSTEQEDKNNRTPAKFKIRAVKPGVKNIEIQSKANPSNKLSFQIIVRQPAVLNVDILAIQTQWADCQTFWTDTRSAPWYNVPEYFGYSLDATNDEDVLKELKDSDNKYPEIGGQKISKTLSERYCKKINAISVSSEFHHKSSHSSYNRLFLCGKNYNSAGIYGDQYSENPNGVNSFENELTFKSSTTLSNNPKWCFEDNTDINTWASGIWYNESQASHGYRFQEHKEHPLAYMRQYHIKKRVKVQNDGNNWVKINDETVYSFDDCEYGIFTKKYFEVTGIKCNSVYVHPKYVLHRYKTQIEGQDYNSTLDTHANSSPSWTVEDKVDKKNLDGTRAIIALTEVEPGVYEIESLE